MEAFADRVFEHVLDDFGPAMAWHPTARRLAVGTLAGTVTTLDLAGGEERRDVSAHEGGVLCLAWCPDGSVLVTGGADGMLRGWNATSGEPAWAHRVSRSWVERVAFSGDGKVVAAAAGRDVTFWTKTGAPLGSVEPLESTVTELLWHKKTKRFVAAVYGGLRWLSSGKASPVRVFSWKGSLLSASLSPDERWIAAGCQDASVQVWDTVSGQGMAMTGFPTKVKALAWSDRGPLLATGSGRQVTLWSFAGKGPAGSRGEPLLGHDGRVTDVAWAGSDWLLSSSDAGELFAWRRRDSAGPVPIEDVALMFERLSVSPDGSCVAVSTEKGGLLGLALDGMIGIS